jgi:hypothetical protein
MALRPLGIEQHSYRRAFAGRFGAQKKEAFDAFAPKASRRMDERAVFAVSPGLDGPTVEKV